MKEGELEEEKLKEGELEEEYEVAANGVHHLLAMEEE